MLKVNRMELIRYYMQQAKLKAFNEIENSRSKTLDAELFYLASKLATNTINLVERKNG
jgi:hypothetical protein